MLWPLTENFLEIFENTPIDINFKPKYPWEILDFVVKKLQEKLTTKYISSSTKIHPTANIVGNVFMEDNVTIEAFTSIVGPAYIAHDSYIGNGCLIRNSFIGPHNEVGFSTEIARSITSNNCGFHRNSFLDSIADNYVKIGGWTGTANQRLDQQKIISWVNGKKVLTNREKLGVIIGANSKIGANVSFMPGVKIGKNCIVGPKLLIKKDIKDDGYMF